MGPGKPTAAGSSGEALLRESNRARPRPAQGSCHRRAENVRGACSARASPESPTSSRRWRRMPTGSLARGARGRIRRFHSGHQPGGGKESTGLVTRFTLTPSGAPTMFPVKLRLLSELDIVKILTNTYYADCRPPQPRPTRTPSPPAWTNWRKRPKANRGGPPSAKTT